MLDTSTRVRNIIKDATHFNMEDNNTYFGPTVESDEDVEYVKVVSGKVSNEKPLWLKEILEQESK